MAFGDKPRPEGLPDWDTDIETSHWNSAWDAHFGKYLGGARPPYVSAAGDGGGGISDRRLASRGLAAFAVKRRCIEMTTRG